MSDWYIVWLVKSLFCKHNFVNYYIVFGDEINFSNGKRICQVCTKCGKGRYI